MKKSKFLICKQDGIGAKLEDGTGWLQLLFFRDGEAVEEVLSICWKRGLVPRFYNWNGKREMTFKDWLLDK